MRFSKENIKKILDILNNVIFAGVLFFVALRASDKIPSFINVKQLEETVGLLPLEYTNILLIIFIVISIAYYAKVIYNNHSIFNAWFRTALSAGTMLLIQAFVDSNIVVNIAEVGLYSVYFYMLRYVLLTHKRRISKKKEMKQKEDREEIKES